METLDKSKLSNDELIALNHPEDTGDGAALPAETTTTQATEVEKPAASDAGAVVVADASAAAADATATDAAATDPAEAAPNTRAQLRASRQSEGRLHRQLVQARQELADIKATQASAKPGTTADDDDDIDGVIAELEPDLPAIAKVGKVVKRLKAQIAELSAKQPTQAAATPAEPEFEPEQLPSELQDIVDDMPDLYAWQHDKDQAKYNLAGRFNETLLASQKWKDKPAADRFAEVGGW